MKNTFILVLAVIVTILAGMLVIQVSQNSSPRPANVPSIEQLQSARPGGKVVKVSTHVEIPSHKIGTSLEIQ